MVEDFPGNSHREKEQRVSPPSSTKAIEGKNIPRITSGEVIQRKKPVGSRFKEFFFNGPGAKVVLSYVAAEIVVPRVKDLLLDGAMESMQRMMFGDARPRHGSNWRPAGSGPIRYDGYSRPQGGSTPPWRRDEPRRDISRQSRSMHDFREIVLDSRGEAEQVIDTLFDIVKEYNQATVSDLYQMVGITPAYTDNKYGWTELRGANVQIVRGGGYLLNLPRPEPLD